MTQYDIPETPWNLIAEQRNVLRKIWNRDFSLQPPVLKLGWDWEFALPERTFRNFYFSEEAKRRVEDPDFDARCQLEMVRHEIECLKCGAEVGIPLANTPAFDLLHFWEEYFLPYNNRLAREFGGLITYHCCLRYDTHFEAIVKTEGFIGFDPGLSHNALEKIEAALVKARGIWTQPLGPDQLDLIRRLRGKIGMFFAVHGQDRADAIRKAQDFLAALAVPPDTASAS
jgi:hypothetical protein